MRAATTEPRYMLRGVGPSGLDPIDPIEDFGWTDDLAESLALLAEVNDAGDFCVWDRARGAVI